MLRMKSEFVWPLVVLCSPKKPPRSRKRVGRTGYEIRVTRSGLSEKLWRSGVSSLITLTPSKVLLHQWTQGWPRQRQVSVLPLVGSDSGASHLRWPVFASQRPVPTASGIRSAFHCVLNALKSSSPLAAQANMNPSLGKNGSSFRRYASRFFVIGQGFRPRAVNMLL